MRGNGKEKVGIDLPGSYIVAAARISITTVPGIWQLFLALCLPFFPPFSIVDRRQLTQNKKKWQNYVLGYVQFYFHSLEVGGRRLGSDTWVVAGVMLGLYSTSWAYYFI